MGEFVQAIASSGSSPYMMKKDRFLAGLQESLRWRVELKKPGTFEDSLEVARNKEWKLKRLSQLGMETLPRGQEVKHVRFMESQVPREAHHHVHAVAPVVSPVVLVASVEDDELRQDMRQVVDLMKNLSINLLSNTQSRGRQSNQPTGNNGQNQNGGWLK